MLSVEFGLKLIQIVGVYSLLQTSTKQLVDLLVVDEIRPKKQKTKDRSWGVTPTLGFSNLTHGISQISGWLSPWPFLQATWKMIILGILWKQGRKIMKAYGDGCFFAMGQAFFFFEIFEPKPFRSNLHCSRSLKLIPFAILCHACSMTPWPLLGWSSMPWMISANVIESSNY